MNPIRSIAALAMMLACGLANAATCYITEIQYIPAVTYQAARMPAVANQTVAIAGSSTQSAAFNIKTQLIRVHCDAICSLNIGGTNPTATATNMRLVAGQTEYFQVAPGDKLAVITNN